MTSPPRHADPRFINRTVLITGGAKRVGRAIALDLAQLGFDIAITYRRSRDQADQLVDQIIGMGRQAMAIEVDLAQPDAAEAVHGQFTTRFRSLYGLINNASMYRPTPLDSVSAEDFHADMAVHVRSPLLLIQRFAPMLAAQTDHPQDPLPGRVVNLLDIHAMGRPRKDFVSYNISKAALHELTRTAAVAMAPNVTVNAVAPGVVAWAESYDEPEKQAYLAQVPLAREGTPQDAADAVRFLVCEAQYVTGQVIRVDGGRMLR